MQLSALSEGVYYIGIYGYHGGHFSILASVYADTSDSCNNECSGHGSCAATVCTCYPGYTGSYCETRTYFNHNYYNLNKILTLMLITFWCE